MADINHCTDPVDKDNWDFNDPIDGRVLCVDTTFKADLKTADFSNKVFHGDAVFVGAVFECFADFSEATFLGEADFTGAVFKKGVSFAGATFGPEYKQDFGNKRLIFYRDSGKKEWDKEKKKYEKSGDVKQYLVVLEIGETGAVEKTYEDDLSDRIEGVIKKYGLEKYEAEVREAFDIYFESVSENVLFDNCWFCHPDLEQKADNQTKRDIDFSNCRFFNSANVSFRATAWSNGGSVSFHSATWSNGGGVSFTKATWSNSGNVSFNNAIWRNGFHIFFSSTVWCNGGTVSFKKADWSNYGDVSFEHALWRNIGDYSRYSSPGMYIGHDNVEFDSAIWRNSGNVSFKNAIWSNDGDVGFKETVWGNSGDVSFDFAAWSNGGTVSFSSVNYEHKGELVLKGLVLLNNGKSAIKINRIRDGLYIKFDQCLFMNSGPVDFSGNRFPQNTSVTFHHCYFAGMGYKGVKVDFSNVSWSHAVFEGGPIKWVEGLLGESKQKVTLQDVLEAREIINLPGATREWLSTLGGPEKITVPHYTTVFDDVCRVSWRVMSVDSAKSLTFQLVNLARSQFYGVTLKHIELNAPSWLRKRDKLWNADHRPAKMANLFADKSKLIQKLQGKRNILFTEEEIWPELTGQNQITSSKKPQLSAKLKNVVNQYDQVRSNLEKYGDYLGAGDFHYGTQHVRRIGRKRKILDENDVSGTEHFLRWIFYLSSGYGERPFRALIMTFLLILGFSCLSIGFHHLGWVQLDSVCVVWYKTKCIDEGFWVTQVFKTAGHIISPFWKNSSFLEATDKTAWYYVYLFFANLFIYLQAVMLALAVRRRFKR